jgi:hypothetical protein
LLASESEREQLRTRLKDVVSMLKAEGASERAAKTLLHSLRQ